MPPRTCHRHSVNEMGGHRQRKAETVKAIHPGQDTDQIYQAACVELAAEINWDFESVLYHWSQLALCRMFCGEPQPIAEFMAMRNVREALDVRGRDAN